MLRENAVVVDYQNGVATVKCHSKSACGQCAAKSSCGTAALAELNGEHSEHIFTMATITPVSIGQTVEVGLEERPLLFSILLVYVIPLVTLLCATLIGASLFLQEWMNAMFIFFSTALSFVIVRFLVQKLQRKSAYQPILLRVL
ncbi:SoxR reducing system RseC family protein [Actinobacillus seminis]|uniref:SoxR reducing system RseC family protein n=1 Tax=Actinobacillus seminis TaxID=722 RepID=UPI003B949DE3